MSSVIRPAGPLPSRVYWVRRLLLLVVLVLALCLAWWLVGQAFGGTGGNAEVAAEQSSEGSPGGGDAGSGPGGAGTTQTRDDDRRHDSDPGRHGHEDDGNSNGKGQGNGNGNGNGKPRHRSPVAAPTGDCEPAHVGVRVEVDNTRQGGSTPVIIRLTSLQTPACTLAITPDTLMLRITSGDDVIWSSDDCPDELLARELDVRTRPTTPYTFDWNGYGSTTSCSAPGEVAPPGSYTAEVALIGATTHTAMFEVR